MDDELILKPRRRDKYIVAMCNWLLRRSSQANQYLHAMVYAFGIEEYNRQARAIMAGEQPKAEKGTGGYL